VEGEVLEKIIVGKTNQEIADELFFSEKTVENHITKFGKKLGLRGHRKVRTWVERLYNNL